MASTKNKTQRHTASIALHVALQIEVREHVWAIMNVDIFVGNFWDKITQILAIAVLTFRSLLLHAFQTLSTRL